MDKKKVKWLYYETVLILLVLPILSAVTIDSGTSLYNVDLNLTINCTSTYYASLVDINSTGTTFNQFNRDNGLSYISFTINETNKFYYCSNLPYVTKINNTYYIINSNLSNNITANVGIYDELREYRNQGRYVKGIDNTITYYSNEELDSKLNNGVLILDGVVVSNENSDNLFILTSLVTNFNMFEIVILFILNILPILTIIIVYLIMRLLFNNKINGVQALAMITALLISVFGFSIIITALVGG